MCITLYICNILKRRAPPEHVGGSRGYGLAGSPKVGAGLIVSFPAERRRGAAPSKARRVENLGNLIPKSALWSTTFDEHYRSLLPL